MRRTSLSCCAIILTCCGVWTKNIGCAGVRRKAGTPVAQHRDERDHIGLPASTSSFAFFSESFANCVRLGLLMSAIRNVGCAPVLLGTKRWAGSCLTGGGLPGRGVHSPPTETHPTFLAAKSGGLCCARAVATPAHTRPASRPEVSECRGLFPRCS